MGCELSGNAPKFECADLPKTNYELRIYKGGEDNVLYLNGSKFGIITSIHNEQEKTIFKGTKCYKSKFFSNEFTIEFETKKLSKGFIEAVSNTLSK